MEILPLYKVIVGLQGCIYKIDSLYGGSLKLEDRDFSSYLSSLSERLSHWIDRNEGSYPYLYYSTSTMNGGDYLYHRVEINSLECCTHSMSLYTLLLFSISFHKVPHISRIF